MIDKPILDLLADKYYKIIFRFCMVKLHYKVDVAEDLTQDVFMFLCEKADVLTDDNLLSWLYSVAGNKLYEYFRKIKKAPFQEDETVVAYDRNDYFIVNFSDESYINDKKMDIIKSLNIDDRNLIKLRYIEKMKHSEIAFILDTTESAIKMRCKRLKESMKEAINEYKKNL